MFINSHCHENVDSRVKTSDFARALRHWVDDQFIHWRPSNLQIRTMMRHLGHHVKTINGYEHYAGIKLKRSNPDGELLTDVDGDSDDDDWDDWDDCDANNVTRIR